MRVAKRRRNADRMPARITTQEAQKSLFNPRAVAVVVASAMAGRREAIDINSAMVGAGGAIAVDAPTVPRT
jgi:hypothetical protein